MTTSPERSVGPVETPPQFKENHRHLELYQNAVQCHERGNVGAAVRMLQEAIALRHDFAEAHVMLGQIYQGQGRLEDASDHYILAIHYRENLQGAHLNFGLLALDEGRFGEARHYLEKAVELDPDNARAHNALGAALLKLAQVDAAAIHFRRALEINPELAEAHSNLGYILFREFEQFQDGARHIETALRLAPGNEAVLCNWTMVLQQQGRFEEMLELSRRLLSANPDLPEVRVNRALVLLTLGQFRDGWHDYEARKLLPHYTRRQLPWPEWDGASLAGKTIFVYGEQGIGDEIMFASCLPDIMRLARDCMIECSPKLVRLFQRSFPAAHVISNGASIAETKTGLLFKQVDYQAALGSLPRYLRNAISDFPQHSGYLKADPARRAYWESRLDQVGGSVKVGISWRGGMKSTRSSLRSIALERWLPILGCSGAAFVSLQYTDCREEIAKLHAETGIVVHHWQDALDDYDETAALVSALDLVITVQTAIAHLAGALGKTAWVMISAVPEWRYMEKGDNMPWYPALRLIRQQTAGDWATVIDTIAQDLREFISRFKQNRYKQAAE